MHEVALILVQYKESSSAECLMTDPSSTQDAVIASSYFSIYIHFISIIPSFSEDMAAAGHNIFTCILCWHVSVHD